MNIFVPGMMFGSQNYFYNNKNSVFIFTLLFNLISANQKLVVLQKRPLLYGSMVAALLMDLVTMGYTGRTLWLKQIIFL